MTRKKADPGPALVREFESARQLRSTIHDAVRDLHDITSLVDEAWANAEAALSHHLKREGPIECGKVRYEYLNTGGLGAVAWGPVPAAIPQASPKKSPKGSAKV